MTEYFCAKLATLLQGLSEVWERFLFLFFLEYGPVWCHKGQNFLYVRAHINQSESKSTNVILWSRSVKIDNLWFNDHFTCKYSRNHSTAIVSILYVFDFVWRCLDYKSGF